MIKNSRPSDGQVFTWNPYLYEVWVEGGSDWISGLSGGKGSDDSDDGGNAGNDASLRQDASSSRVKSRQEEGENLDITQKKREIVSTAEEVKVCRAPDPEPACVCTPGMIPQFQQTKDHDCYPGR